jgi:hypothetical protein
MAIGKNAKKRAARRAFHASTDTDSPGSMPYSFKVVEYKDKIRRVLTFASLTSYKEYRERFFSCHPTGKLTLASPNDETVSDTRGESFRSKVINQGADTSKARPKGLAQFKGNRLVESVTGKRFRQEGFSTK